MPLNAYFNFLVSDRFFITTGLLGLISAWLLFFPSTPHPFSEVDLRFKFLIRWKLTNRDIQRDYFGFWPRVPMSVYWTGFIVYHLAVTGGLFIVACVISLVWKDSKTGEPAISFSRVVQLVGAGLAALLAPNAAISLILYWVQ